MSSTEHILENSKEIINKVIITGFVGKDPTFDVVGKDLKLSKFSVATNQDYKTAKQETKTETLWHNIVAWGALAEKVHESIKKGNRVTLEGKINYKQYTDKNGVKKTYTEIILSDVINHTKKLAA